MMPDVEAASDVEYSTVRAARRLNQVPVDSRGVGHRTADAYSIGEDSRSISQNPISASYSRRSAADLNCGRWRRRSRFVSTFGPEYYRVNPVSKWTRLLQQNAFIGAQWDCRRLSEMWPFAMETLRGAVGASAYASSRLVHRSAEERSVGNRVVPAPVTRKPYCSGIWLNDNRLMPSPTAHVVASMDMRWLNAATVDNVERVSEDGVPRLDRPSKSADGRQTPPAWWGTCTPTTRLWKSFPVCGILTTVWISGRFCSTDGRWCGRIPTITFAVGGAVGPWYWW